jgi:hypothetical protein
MARLQPGDIILLHDLYPEQDGLYQYWLDEIDQLFARLKGEYKVISLLEIIKCNNAG